MDRKLRQMESNMKRQKLFNTQLEDLPVEVLLNVLSFLEQPDLYRVGQVSKTLNSICLVQSCQQKIIFGNNTRPEKTPVPIKVVKKILDRGCKTLCLRRCRLSGGIPLLTYLHSKADEQLASSQLINLDMHQCEFTRWFLETLLSSTHSLKAFSLTDHNINQFFFPFLSPLFNTFYSQNGQTLQKLNLAFTHVVSRKHIELIVKNCIGLKEVDFTDCCLSYKGLNLLVNSIRGWVPKFATGLIYQIEHSSKSIWVTRLLFCQNNSLMGGSFWPKDSLITFIIFELCLIWCISPVANFGTHPLDVVNGAIKHLVSSMLAGVIMFTVLM